MNQILEVVCRKMAELACLSYDDISWGDGTHLQLEWLESQENAFKTWLAGELKDNKDLRAAMMAFPARKGIKVYKKLAEEFCFQYGFKVKKDD